jgi:type II secretory pathway pseudopilin PulG
MEDLESNKNKKFPLWGELLVGFSVIGVLAVLLAGANQSKLNKASVSRAKGVVLAALNMQKENYKETGRFIQSWDEMGGIQYHNDNDSYEIQVSLIGRDSIITATPKKDGLRSLTGFTFLSGGSI